MTIRSIKEKVKEFFGKSDEKWDWENFQSTAGYPVSPNLIDWVIGQEHAIQECKLCIDEWVNKLGWLNEKQWWKSFEIIEKRREAKLFGHHLFWLKGKTLEMSPKSNPKEMLPAGPFLLMLGDAGCLIGDERIALRDGTFDKLENLGQTHLQDIYIPIFQSGKMSEKYKGVATVFHSYKNQPVMEVITESGKRIVGTYNHPLLTKDGWKRLDRLSKSDYLRVVTKIPCWKKNYYGFIDEKIGGLIGYALADGGIDKYAVTLYVSDIEKELLPKLRQIVIDSFGIEASEYIRIAHGINRTVDMNILEINRKWIAEKLSFLREKRVPIGIFQSPDSVVSEFLSWFFTGDGSVFSGGRGRYGVTCEQAEKRIELLRDIQMLLLRFGIYSTVKGRHLFIKRGNSIIRFAKYIGFKTERKQRKLKELVEYVKPLRKRHNQLWEKIVSIKSFGTTTVYDVEVPHRKQFVANGIVSHNTGKSLLGRAMQNYMTELYRQKGIKLYDVCAWQNKANPSQPQISIHPSPQGTKIIQEAYKQEQKKGRLGKWTFRALMGLMVGFGTIVLGYIGLQWLFDWNNVHFQYDNLMSYLMAYMYPVAMGITIIGTAGMLYFFSRIMGGGLTGNKQKGIGNAENTKAPKLLIDNSNGNAPFIDATGHGSAQLFGSIAWDPYQELSEDTEILTRNGWKFIGEVTKNDEVATLRDGRYLEWNKPYGDYIKEQYDGKMVHVYSDYKFNNGSLDILVHPEHRLLIKDGEKWVFKKAKDCVGISIVVKKDTVWISNKIMDKDMVELWGWFITEGSSYSDGYHKTVKFTQIKPETRKEIMDLLRRMNIPFNISYKDIKISHNVKLYNIFHKLGHQEFHYIPQELKELNSYYLRILLETMIKGDGTRYENGTWRYYTCSKKLADDIQEVALKLGIATIVRQTSPSQTGRKQWYVLSVKSESKSIPRYVNYFGMIRCLAVKNETLYIRRNGKTAWCGNTGGLGTPEHQRVTAGDIHRAHLGIFYIDEIKNLTGHEAITLLTVLEDGQLPIAMRESMSGSGTAAMAVSTEPVPCMFFLIAAGNLDSLSMIHPALLDRIYGYGKTVYMSNDMPNTPENRRKYVQFISQEVKRFHLLPLSRNACIAVIEEAVRRSGKNNTITCKFRPMIGTIKTASVLAQNEGLSIVERKHVDEALSEHCKSIALQVMEKHIENQIMYNVMVDPHEKPKIGQIHGLAVSTINSEGTDMVGSVLTIRASCLKKDMSKKTGYFTVTGVQTKDSSYVQNSIAKIRHVILQLYGIDIEQDCFTHVDFAQEHGVEGPSAGITMTLALASVLLQKRIRQDVAVTGEINIANGETKGESGIVVTPIGGAHEKIMAAQRLGFKKVCIPMRNYEKNINSSDYKIKVVGCSTIEDYIKEVFVDEKHRNKRKD